MQALIVQHPVLAALIVFLVVAALLAPLVLKLAGFSASEIADLLKTTLAEILDFLLRRKPPT